MGTTPRPVVGDLIWWILPESFRPQVAPAMWSHFGKVTSRSGSVLHVDYEGHFWEQILSTKGDADPEIVDLVIRQEPNQTLVMDYWIVRSSPLDRPMGDSIEETIAWLDVPKTEA